jgi:starch phosphorylase
MKPRAPAAVNGEPTVAPARDTFPVMHSSAFVPHLPDSIRGLAELALDLRSSSDYGAEEFWRQLAPDIWAVTRNPWLILQTASETRLRELAEDPTFRRELDLRLAAHGASLGTPGWFQETHAGSPLGAVAYLSLEFGLSESLPIYSGGLGILAGDFLKAASDLGVPLVGVGLLYQQGYFRQVLDAQGSQHELFPYNDPTQLPITPVRDAEGGWLRMAFEPPGRTLWLRVWEARVGRVRLYLLDSNDPLNTPADRGITGELYGGGPELRIQQESVLGIGGWRLLQTLGIRPEICHLNEGHAAFAILARAASFVEETGQPFDVALAATRPGNLFTTHTPVAAGFDRFEPALAARYLAPLAERVGVPVERILALGRANPADASEPFHMAYLAIRGSGAVNGVSRLHGEVSRRLFQPLFPRWPEREVPVGHVTNGVHTPSWEAAPIGEILDAACGPQRWHDCLEAVECALRGLSDEQLWELRGGLRRALVDFVRIRLARQRAAAGAVEARVAGAGLPLDPNALTLGIARRFATYKRPNLLLEQPERLARLLADPRRPVQLLVAGKAHPADASGKALIHAWSEFLRRPELHGRAVFLDDYDMLLAERLVQGVDVWINTPRRPWEASGTSGMKVLVNGGLNVSELDGWWAEAFAPDVGFALGDGREHGEDPTWDAAEGEALYGILETQVIPEFYQRDARGIPLRWLARVRESMARLTPRFSTNRMVREYTETYYLPLAAAYRRRAADQGKQAAAIVRWRDAVAAHWGGVHVASVTAESTGDRHRFRAQVYLGDLAPDAARVELYAEPIGAEQAVREGMARDERLAGAANAFRFSASVPATRPASDYTVRVIPHYPGAGVPLESNAILWAD